MSFYYDQLVAFHMPSYMTNLLVHPSFYLLCLYIYAYV